MTTGQQMVLAEKAMDDAGIEYTRIGTGFYPDALGRYLTAAEVLSWLAGTHATFIRPVTS